MTSNTKSKQDVISTSPLDDILDSISPKDQQRVDRKMMLAAKIDESIKAKGWSKSEFAKRMDKHNSEVSKWLSGTHTFTTDTLWDIGDLLGIELVYPQDKPAVSVVFYKPVQVKNHVEAKVFWSKDGYFSFESLEA